MYNKYAEENRIVLRIPKRKFLHWFSRREKEENMESKYMDLINTYKDKAREAGKSGKLSDQELEGVTGGVGGANEATCEVCGAPMIAGTYPTVGKGWQCPACGIATNASDADVIEIIRYMEQAGLPVNYPKWWGQVFPASK